MADPLELDAAARRRLADAVLRYADDYLENLAAAPASYPQLDPAQLPLLAAPPEEDGRDPAEIFAALDVALATGINTASGKFLSYIPSGGIYSAALARLLGAVTNRYTGGTHGAPGLIAIEAGIVRWMCDLFALPPSASGVLFSGGSIANLTATVAARSRLGDDFGAGVVYTSERAHHSISKAARIAGIHPARIRLIPADAALRLDVDALEAAMATDVSAGLTPMLIAATAGTTDTGTVDPLSAAADLAAAHGAWFHIDAAYGGFFVLTKRGRDRLSGIERADSITIDAHKSLFLPFGVGGLLVRDETALLGALEERGSYMQDVPAHGSAIPNYFAMGPELTRPARGLEVWLALQLHGVAAFRDALDRMLDLTEWTAAALQDIAGIEVVADPELSIVAFRATAGDGVSRQIAARLIDSGEIHISTTTVAGRFIVRLAFLSQRTTESVARRAVELVGEALAPG